MIEPVAVPTRAEALLAPVPKEDRRELLRCRRVFDETEEWRRRFDDLEAPVFEVEEEFETRPPRGKRFRAVLAEAIAAVSGASEVHGRVRDREQAALERVQEVVKRLRATQKSDGPDLTPVVEALQQWYRFRCVEIEWIDGELQHSHMLVNLPAETSTPTELYTLLRRRREYMDRVNTLVEKARRAEAALFGDADPAPEEAPVATRENGEEEIMVKAKDDAPKTKDSPPTAEKGNGNGNGHDEKAADAGLAPPFADLEKEVAEALARARAGAQAALDRASARAAREREELESRLTGELRQAERDYEELMLEHEAAEEQVKALRHARDEARQAAEAREKEIAAERAKIEEERKTLAEAVRAANQERDEALVLIASLTRRLGTPGLPKES